MLRVVCFKWGDKYSSDYVVRLQSMFARHLSLPHTFTCFTENPVDGVHCEPLPTEYGSWWCKIGAFKSGLVKGPALLCDLDMLIVGSLDWVAEYFDVDFAAVENWGSKRREGPLYTDELSSALMIWSGNGATDRIYQNFSQADIRRLHPHGDQSYVTEQMRDVVTLIPQYRMCSFKRHCANGPPSGASVVAFHGRPRPHEVNDAWVKDAWQ